MSGADRVHAVSLRQCRSTQDEAQALLDAGEHRVVAVVAAHQEAGRGREGRQWVDVPGRSLLLSVGLVAPNDVSKAHAWMEQAAVVACDVVRTLHRVSAEHELPNDLVVAGRKVGGLLADARSVASGRIERVVFGVGINLAGERSQVGGREATTLAAEGAQAFADPALGCFNVARLELAEVLCSRFAALAGVDAVVDGWLSA